MEFPNQRRFAFSILDDTDDSTLENVRPVYDRLRHHGVLATKTVWPLSCPEGSRIFFAADTLARCHPVVIIEQKSFSERYGVEQYAAIEFLRCLGASVVHRVVHDFVLAWPPA